VRGMLRFAAWATLTFAAAWFIAHPYQRALAGLAGRLVAPPGTEIEWLDLEIFFPFDLSVYAALCLASTWTPWRVRLRALGIGLAALVVVELLTLIVVMKVMLASAGQPAAQADATQRFVVGVIRLTGLVAAGCAWLYLLGWQRLPQFAQHLAARRGTTRGGKR
jgi:hypothetical protein